MIEIAWMPQWGQLTPLHMPAEPLPEGDSEAIGFSFALTALQTGQLNHAFHAPFLLWGINAHDDQAAGFDLQLWHQLAKGPRRLVNRHAPAANLAGSAASPLLLRRPYLFDTGDSLTVEVKNLDAGVAASNIQLALFGVVLPREAGADDEAQGGEAA